MENIIRNCKMCELYQYEEVGDSDYGAIYSDYKTCELGYDLDENSEEIIEQFDRECKRDCCKLDFWKVADIDTEINGMIDENNLDEFDFDEDRAYKRFKEKYKNLWEK